MPFFLGGLVKGAARKAASKVKGVVTKYANAAGKAGDVARNLVDRIRSTFGNVKPTESDSARISEKEAKQRKEHLLYGVTNPIWDDLPRHINEQGELVISNDDINQRLFDEYGVDNMDDLYKAVEKELGISFDDVLKEDYEEFYTRVIDLGLEIFTSKRVANDSSLKLDELLKV